MSRKKKSRLTKTDVNRICEMQRKIDAYESYIIGLAGFSSLDKEVRYVVIEAGTEMDYFVGKVWRNIEKMKSVCTKHMEELCDNNDD